MAKSKKKQADKPAAAGKARSGNPVGRPPEPVPSAMADKIIDWIAAGKTLRDFCRLDGNPAWRTVYEWLEKDEAFAARFARARDMGADAIAEETLEIIDTHPERADSETGSHYDSAHVSWMRNRVEHRLKLLAKWNPKKYGDKLELGGKLETEQLVRVVNLTGVKVGQGADGS